MKKDLGWPFFSLPDGDPECSGGWEGGLGPQVREREKAKMSLFLPHFPGCRWPKEMMLGVIPPRWASSQWLQKRTRPSVNISSRWSSHNRRIEWSGLWGECCRDFTGYHEVRKVHTSLRSLGYLLSSHLGTVRKLGYSDRHKQRGSGGKHQNWQWSSLPAVRLTEHRGTLRWRRSGGGSDKWLTTRYEMRKSYRKREIIYSLYFKKFVVFPCISFILSMI